LESQFTPDDVECEHGMHYRDCSNNVCVMRDCKAALAALDAALAEQEKERAEVAAPARNGVASSMEEIDILTPESYRTTEPTAKPEPYTLAELFAQFAAKQKPLDADMAAIINANLDSLYITDEPTNEPEQKPEPVAWMHEFLNPFDEEDTAFRTAAEMQNADRYGWMPLYLAPPAAAKPEPVHPGYIIGSHWLETAYSRIAAGEAEAEVLTEVLGARGWVKPEPATDGQIFDAYQSAPDDDFYYGWCAAERFHGIRGSK
jgi:hypothetical protein